jgi:hypothetical protein
MHAPSFIPDWNPAEPEDFDYFAWWMNYLTASNLHSKMDIALAFAMMSEKIELLETQKSVETPVIPQPQPLLNDDGPPRGIQRIWSDKEKVYDADDPRLAHPDRFKSYVVTNPAGDAICAHHARQWQDYCWACEQAKRAADKSAACPQCRAPLSDGLGHVVDCPADDSSAVP